MATKPKTTTKKAPAQKPAPQPKPTAIDKDTYLVVIPWLKAGAQGDELAYAVAGWQRHFKEKHLIIVVGEDDPKLKGVKWIKSLRVPESEGQYRQHLDYVSCFRKVRAAYPESEGFIFVADDVYAVHDFDIIDVKVLKYQTEKIADTPNDPNPWKRDKAKGLAVLTAEGYPTRNYTTHLPQWYEWDKLEKLWDKYDMDHESYLMEDLYFNIYYGDRLMHYVGDIASDPFYKCGVYRPNPRLNLIEEAFTKRIWIQNSPDGWIPELEQMLKNYYGL